MLEGLTCLQRQNMEFLSWSRHLLSTHMGNTKACLLFGLQYHPMVQSHCQLHPCSLQMDLEKHE
uniref:Uncharacterized protein n=1 Tax=Arundo donax TaxID=35708 RepID=A0A0A9DQK9_ARUDO